MAIVSRLGTDKVTAHSCQHFYYTYLEPLRDRHVHLMEIDLGRKVSYGPGTSFQVGLVHTVLCFNGCQ